MIEQKDLPVHLRDDASYLQCSVCGRKSWSGQVNELCNMPLPPDGIRCHGLLEGKKG